MVLYLLYLVCLDIGQYLLVPFILQVIQLLLEHHGYRLLMVLDYRLGHEFTLDDATALFNSMLILEVLFNSDGVHLTLEFVLDFILFSLVENTQCLPLIIIFILLHPLFLSLLNIIPIVSGLVNLTLLLLNLKLLDFLELKLVILQVLPPLF